jgi:hypothetical protein
MSLLREITLMKTFTKLITILFISLLSSPSFSETVSMDDLVEIGELYYKKFTDTPFTGEISGKENGSFKSGKKRGLWKSYFDNGRLWEKGNYKDGKREGLWKKFYKEGEFLTKENYKDGKLDGFSEVYHKNGQLAAKGNFKDGKEDGLLEFFNEDGSPQRTETYKDGELLE